MVVYLLSHGHSLCCFNPCMVANAPEFEVGALSPFPMPTFKYPPCISLIPHYQAAHTSYHPPAGNHHRHRLPPGPAGHVGAVTIRYLQKACHLGNCQGHGPPGMHVVTTCISLVTVGVTLRSHAATLVAVRAAI